MKNIGDTSARPYSALGPGNSLKSADVKKTHDTCTRAHIHTLERVISTSRDETRKSKEKKKRENKCQRASEGFGWLVLFS